MINFFTKLLTPVFIGMGLVSPGVEMPPYELISHTEIVTEEIQLIQEKTPAQLKIENLEKEIEELKKEKEVKKTIVVKPVVQKVVKKTYVAPVVIIPAEEVVDIPVVEKTDGECGVSNSVILKENYDKNTLCSVGALTDLKNKEGELEFICKAIEDGANDAKCFAYMEINGLCKSYNEKISGLPVDEACSSGQFFSGNSSKDLFSWSCLGFNGGSNKKCSADREFYNASNCYGEC